MSYSRESRCKSYRDHFVFLCRESLCNPHEQTRDGGVSSMKRFKEKSTT